MRRRLQSDDEPALTVRVSGLKQAPWAATIKEAR